MADKPEKKLVKARVAMIFDTPFFGYLALNLEPVEKSDMKMPTMATDGVHLFYDPGFVTKTPLEELKAIIAHEILHVILWHLPRAKGREQEKWNWAADYAANSILKKELDDKGKEVFPIPHGLYSEEYKDLGAEAIYGKLPHQLSGTQVMIDDHGGWGDWGKGDGDVPGDPGTGKSADQDGIEQKWREQIAQSATQARMRGLLPSHLAELVDGVLQPKLDWRTILRDKITSCSRSDFKMFPSNKKHIWRGFYLPGITGEEIKIAACIDTSGSVGKEEMNSFLSEVKGICDAYEHHTIYLYSADAEVHQRWELHEFDKLPTEFEGRGGTDFCPVLEEAAKLDEITAFVYLTDCYGSYPAKAPRFPVIWVSITDPASIPDNYKPKFGSVVYLNKDVKK